MRIRVAGIALFDSSILFAKHVKKKGVYWLLPGGGVKAGETLEEALKRELMEELGAEATVLELLFVVEVNSHRGYHMVQPTFKVVINNPYNLKVGSDGRVAGYDLFDLSVINQITIYPDIKAELMDFLKYNKIEKKYIYKKWID